MAMQPSSASPRASSNVRSQSSTSAWPSRTASPRSASRQQKPCDKSVRGTGSPVRHPIRATVPHCIPKGLIASNFATAVIPKPRPKARLRPYRPWSWQELFAVLHRAGPHLRAVLAVMANTRLDPSDALNLRRDKIADGVICGVRGKTGVEVPIPIGPTMRAALDAAPRHDAGTILASSKGTAWTYDGFSIVWHRSSRPRASSAPP